MKKIFVLAFIPVFAFAQKSYKIVGNISGLKDSTLVFLNDGQDNNVAQAYCIKNKFVLEGKTEVASYFRLGFIGIQDVYEMFIGNETIKLSGNIKNLKKLVTNGSETHTSFVTFLDKFYPMQDNLSKLYNSKNTEKNTAKKDSLDKAFNNLFKARTDLVSLFLATHPTSTVSTFLLLNLYPFFGDETVLEQKFSQLSGDAKKGLFASLIEQKIAAAKKPVAGAIGTIVPDFSQNDVNNKPVSIKEFRGKYVLLDFWASWCGPCRRENPNVVAAYNRYKDKNFTILGISMDQDKNKWLKAIADDGLPWQHVSDLKGWGNAVGQMFQVSSIPANFLLDPTGKIIATNLRGEDLEKKLEEVLH